MIPTFSSVNVPTRMTEDASIAAAQMQRLMLRYARTCREDRQNPRRATE